MVRANPEMWLEDKGLVVAIHHANASTSDVARLRDQMTQALLPLHGSFRGIAGERTFELAPVEMGNKGTAVCRELALAGRGALPVFVGDDAVDEPAFAVLTGGITIRVGHPCHTRAYFRLAGVNQVRVFLERLSKEIGS